MVHVGGVNLGSQAGLGMARLLFLLGTTLPRAPCEGLPAWVRGQGGSTRCPVALQPPQRLASPFESGSPLSHPHPFLQSLLLVEISPGCQGLDTPVTHLPPPSPGVYSDGHLGVYQGSPGESASGASWLQGAPAPAAHPPHPVLPAPGGILSLGSQAFNVWLPAGLILPGDTARPVTTLKGLDLKREPQALFPECLHPHLHL